MSNSLIHANQIGSMIGEPRDVSRPNRIAVYLKCPEPGCGGLMSEYAELCSDCDDKRRAGVREAAGDAERLRIRREREARWNAARAAGWTLEELFPKRAADEYVEGESDADPLPTRGEIERRVVENLIKGYYRGTK